MTGPEKLLRDLLPSKKAQAIYHTEIEKVLGIKIFWFLKRWEWKVISGNKLRSPS